MEHGGVLWNVSKLLLQLNMWWVLSCYKHKKKCLFNHNQQHLISIWLAYIEMCAHSCWWLTTSFSSLMFSVTSPRVALRAGLHHRPWSRTMEDGLFPWSDLMVQLSWSSFLNKAFGSLIRCKLNVDQEEWPCTKK